MNTDHSPSRKPVILTSTDDNSPYEVPVEGSLGLLALGYQGLVAWRSKRKESSYNFSEHLFIPKPKKENR